MNLNRTHTASCAAISACVLLGLCSGDAHAATIANASYSSDTTLALDNYLLNGGDATWTIDPGVTVTIPNTTPTNDTGRVFLAGNDTFTVTGGGTLEVDGDPIGSNHLALAGGSGNGRLAIGSNTTVQLNEALKELSQLVLDFDLGATLLVKNLNDDAADAYTFNLIGGGPLLVLEDADSDPITLLLEGAAQSNALGFSRTIVTIGSDEYTQITAPLIIPEPSTLVLASFGVVGFALRRRRRRRV